MFEFGFPPEYIERATGERIVWWHRLGQWHFGQRAAERELEAEITAAVRGLPRR